MKSLVRKWLMGSTTFSDYSKLSVTGELPEKVSLEINGEMIDVSRNHWLLCIEPIVFGLWLEKKIPEERQLARLAYHMHFYSSKNFAHSGRNAEAKLMLDFVDCIEEENGRLILLRLKKSSIHHLSLIKRHLIFFRYYKRDGFTFAKFKSFVSAYSYPRRIRVVSFRNNEYYNIFPMDLLGDINYGNRYVFGLRHTNLALSKIIDSGKIVVSEVPAAYKDAIYQLGKHHSSIPPSLDSLSFDVVCSKNFEFYIPAWAESYKEVKILKTINMGSHMLLWGELVDETVLQAGSERLYLAHFLHYLHQKNRGLHYNLA
jgi:hypothetical protein